jgi:hypothetical protein
MSEFTKRRLAQRLGVAPVVTAPPAVEPDELTDDELEQLTAPPAPEATDGGDRVD